MQRAVCAVVGAELRLKREIWAMVWLRVAASASAPGSAGAGDAGAGMDYASATADGAARAEENGSGRIGDWLISECGLECGAGDARVEHAVGMSGADDGGIFSGGDGAGDAEAVCRGVWVVAAAGGRIADSVPGLGGPAGCFGGLCDRSRCRS